MVVPCFVFVYMPSSARKEVVVLKYPENSAKWRLKHDISSAYHTAVSAHTSICKHTIINSRTFFQLHPHRNWFCTCATQVP